MSPKKLLDFGEVDIMNREQFDAWWDGKEPDSTANPYRKDTPAFWAWAGWKAGVKTEREACAKLCDELVLEHPGRADLTANQCAAAIRARGNK